MKRITSYTHLTTGEGERLSYTYSEIDEGGKLLSQNNKKNIVVLDEKILDAIKLINDFLTQIEG